MKIGIFGGSFDPVHNEHIKIALNATQALGLDILYVVPAKIPPHKQGVVLLDGLHRKKMLELAFKNHPKIVVSDFELESVETSYTYLTVEHFKSIHPGCELYLLVGADMLENFPTWKEPERILQSARLFVTGRDGEDFDNALNVFKKRFSKDNEIIVSKAQGLKVSSTDVRHRLMLGLNVDGLLDKSTQDYIQKNGLYLGDETAQFVKNNLTTKRLEHTVGVMNLAKTYAKRLGEDVNKAVKAAMLHDVAKYLDYKSYPDFSLPDGVVENVIHQYLGAFVAEKVLGITDEDLLNAIRFHTTGRIGMSRLEMIILIADLLEDGRDYDEAPILREAVDKDFFEGFKLCVKRLIAYLLKSETPIYHLTLDCYNYYKNRENS